MKIKRREFLSIGCLGLLYAVLNYRLISLAMFSGSEFKQVTIDSTTRIFPLPAPRGKIFDRKGLPMAYDSSAHAVMFMAKDEKNAIELADSIAPILNKDSIKIYNAAKQSIGNPYPYILHEKLDIKQYLSLSELTFRQKGFRLIEIPMRNYPLKNVGCHVVGYVGEASEEDLKKFSYLHPNQIVGKTGVELIKDKELRGEDGADITIVDAYGNIQKRFEGTKPIPGENVKINIDSDLQEFAQKLLDEKPGAVVALDPRSGEILTLASSPDFDPNEMVYGMSQKEWNELLKRDHPFINRALSAFPPGSTFKIAVSVAALEEGVTTPEELFYCPGYLKVGDHTFYCWLPGGHGHLHIEKAIAQSCDVVFYTLGLRLGPEKIRYYANKFGIDLPSGLKLPGEEIGFLPTKEWKEKEFNDVWYDGDTVNMSIGQGFVRTTPLDVARMMSIFVNKGSFSGCKLISGSDSSYEGLKFSDKTFEIVKEGLRKAVLEGTAQILNSDKYTAIAKTGTAEDPPRKKPHSWIVAAAPSDSPEIVVCVFFEHIGEGASFAGPVAKSYLDYYFSNPSLRER
ncbi:penicillin-binding protein 2 [Thermodesulfobium sp.]